MTTSNSNSPIRTVLTMEQIFSTPNLATLLSSDEQDAIGQAAVNGYQADLKSRSEWEQRHEKGIKLALQVAEQKNFPWENCSNVKFPLLTVAALQFLARMSIMTKGRRLAKVEPLGADPEGRKAKQASRISQHISMQMLEEYPTWMDEDEQCKFGAALVGSAFKKTYYDPLTGTNISEYVPAMNFVVDYFCKDIAKATRATHYMLKDRNYVHERVRAGLYCEIKEGSETPSTPEVTVLRAAADEATGIRRPGEFNPIFSDSHYELLEQYCWLDLDNDGYAEPYTIVVRLDTAQLLRIVPRFLGESDVLRKHSATITALENGLAKVKAEQAGKEEAAKVQGQPAPDSQESLRLQSTIERKIAEYEKAPDNSIVRIEPQQFFTRYMFVPSPDGGLYGLGLSALMGPMNESVNTLVNQLIDSGTMSNTAGGFLGRGVKLKSGRMSFDPFEWKPVDTNGDDLRKSIFPLPVREPSNVLFSLLGLLIEYSEKISGATDVMTGVSPGQNTPAETSRNTVEQGMMLFSGVYNRMWRGFREEIRKFYELNRLFLETSPRFSELVYGPNAILAADDYKANAFRIFPAASPEAVSSQQRRDKATALVAMATQQPGFDRYEVTLNWLESHDYDSIERFYPDPKGPRAIAPPPNPKIIELQQKAKEHNDNMQIAVVELQQAAALNAAKIIELEAKASKHKAEAAGVQDGHMIAALEAEIGARKHHQEGMLRALELLQKSTEAEAKAQQQSEQQSAGSKPKQA